jgi:hypothetical protein
LDAAAEEALLGEVFDEDDLGGDEDGGLAGVVRDGDFGRKREREGLRLRSGRGGGHGGVADGVAVDD